MSQAISWFKTNQMVANPSKFQVMLLGLKTDDSIVLDIGNVSRRGLALKKGRASSVRGPLMSMSIDQLANLGRVQSK